MFSLDKQLEVIRRGVAEIVPENELADKLKHSIESGKPLRMKLGLDPTAPDIHLGHTVVLQKLRQFQEFGLSNLILGDFTARSGPPGIGNVNSSLKNRSRQCPYIRGDIQNSRRADKGGFSQWLTPIILYRSGAPQSTLWPILGVMILPSVLKNVTHKHS